MFGPAYTPAKARDRKEDTIRMAATKSILSIQDQPAQHRVSHSLPLLFWYLLGSMVGLLTSSVASAAHATCTIKGQIMNITLLISVSVYWIHANVFTCGDLAQSNCGTRGKDLKFLFLTCGIQELQCTQHPSPSCQNYSGDFFVLLPSPECGKSHPFITSLS